MPCPSAAELLSSWFYLLEVADSSLLDAPPEWVPRASLAQHGGELHAAAPLEAVVRVPALVDAQLRAAPPQRVCPRRPIRTRPPLKVVS